MVRRPWVRALIPCLLVLLASVGTAFADDRPVRIGGTLSLTGRYASIADYQAKGFRLWVKDVNARGGILGRPVELALHDDRSDPKAAVSLYRRLMVEDRVDLLFAPYSSDITEAILQMTAVQGYPLIISGAAADRIWEKGHEHIVGLFLPASRFSLGFFEMLARQGIDRIAIFHDKSGFGRDLASGARKWADRYGLTVVHGEQFPQGLADFTGLAKKARDAGARAVFLASYLDEAVRMRRAFTAIGWMPRAYYVPVGPGTGEYTKTLGKDADGVFSTSQWNVLTRSRSTVRDPFFEAFVRAYGREPSYFAATAYASGQIYEAAIRKAGSLDRKAIRAVLSTMDATSVIGRYGVDRTGVQIKNTNLIIQLQNGRREVVWPPEHQTAAPRFR
ncbi:MAG: amino acid ABC transporter substrate-binding protein [Nitrospirota bacterium]